MRKLRLQLQLTGPNLLKPVICCLEQMMAAKYYLYEADSTCSTFSVPNKV